MVYFLPDWIVSPMLTRDLWISSQHTQPLHHLSRPLVTYTLINIRLKSMKSKYSVDFKVFNLMC
jgi:hypothetical protein